MSSRSDHSRAGGVASALAAVAVAVATTMVTAGCADDSRPAGPPARSAPAGPYTRPSADPHEPTRRLTGAPLTGSTGLKLLVAAAPPVIVDADHTGLRTLPDLRSGANDPAFVARVGPDVVLYAGCPGCASGDLFVLPGGATALKKIGTGSHFVPALDGRSIWVWRRERPTRCTVHRLGLDGRRRTTGRAVPCDRGLSAETPLGLLWTGPDENSDSVIEPSEGGRAVFRARSINTVVGRQVLIDQGKDRPFTLIDMASGARADIAKPTTVGGPSQALLSPDGRTLAFSFDHPAWPGPRQRMDTWVLDLPTRRWLHVPSMPVHAALKGSGMAWTPDGRLVLLGRFDGTGDILALWRPGETRVAVRTIRLPSHGADNFVVLRAG